MIQGESLMKICSDEGMPDRVTVYRWLQRHDAFRNEYARAREAMMDYYADLIRDIAFDDSGDFFIEDGRTVADHARVQRARLKVDALKWIASKLAPRQYGDKPELPPPGTGNNITRIERVIIGWEDRKPAPPSPPPAQITYDPGPLRARVDPEILVRLVNMIKQRVPRADQQSPDALLDEVMGVIDRALIAEYGQAAEASPAPKMRLAKRGRSSPRRDMTRIR
jgi:hypothetical protein